MKIEMGGVVRAVLDWCTVLAGRGHEMILVTCDASELPTDWNGADGKPRVVAIPGGRGVNGLVGRAALRAWDNLLSPGTVVHLHTPWTASNMQMSRRARGRGAPYIVSIHGMLDDWSMRRRTLKKRFFLAAGGRRYLSAAARVHFTAAAERDQARKWIPAGRPEVIPCLIDLSPYRQLPGPQIAQAKFGLDPSTPTLLFLSRLHEKKGVHTLIDAAAQLRRGGRPFRLIIAGVAAPADHDYEIALRDQVHRLGLDETVKFVGLVTGLEKTSLYQACDLFVLPTHQENFGLVLIESMVCGKPVLTTRGTDIWQEIASAGGAIAENSAADFAQAIERLLKDRTALAQSGQRAREWAMQWLDVGRVAGEYERLYAQVLAEAGAGV
jgi:glycosyltransferase involved in cell wall biosynthesis